MYLSVQNIRSKKGVGQLKLIIVSIEIKKLHIFLWWSYVKIEILIKLKHDGR